MRRQKSLDQSHTEYVSKTHEIPKSQTVCYVRQGSTDSWTEAPSTSQYESCQSWSAVNSLQNSPHFQKNQQISPKRLRITQNQSNISSNRSSNGLHFQNNPQTYQNKQNHKFEQNHQLELYFIAIFISVF